MVIAARTRAALAAKKAHLTALRPYLRLRQRRHIRPDARHDQQRPASGLNRFKAIFADKLICPGPTHPHEPGAFLDRSRQRRVQFEVTHIYYSCSSRASALMTKDTDEPRKSENCSAKLS